MLVNISIYGQIFIKVNIRQSYWFHSSVNFNLKVNLIIIEKYEKLMHILNPCLWKSCYVVQKLSTVNFYERHVWIPNETLETNLRLP